MYVRYVARDGLCLERGRKGGREKREWGEEGACKCLTRAPIIGYWMLCGLWFVVCGCICGCG